MSFRGRPAAGSGLETERGGRSGTEANPGTAARRAVGVLVLAFFAVLWAVAGDSNLPPMVQLPGLIIGLLISGAIAFVGYRLLIRALARPTGQFSATRVDQRRYAVVTGVEFVVLLAAFLVLPRLGLALLLAPVAALIIGTHFFPLAPILRVPFYRVTGVALIAFGLIGGIGVLGHWAGGAAAWATVAALGSALTLWLSALGEIVTIRRQLAAQRASVDEDR